MISNNEEKALNKVICKIVTISSRSNISNTTIWPSITLCRDLIPDTRGTNRAQWNGFRDWDQFQRYMENLWLCDATENGRHLTDLPDAPQALMSCSVQYQPTAQFTNDLSSIIPIQWQFHFVLIQIQIKQSLQDFVHCKTAMLSWHAQNLVMIWWLETDLQPKTLTTEFELRAENH